ncbi:MAG: hypothetical protein ACFFCC_19690, partial [Promethearchaeota archaeon]
MALRGNRIKFHLIKYTYILICLFSIPNLIFRESWVGGDFQPTDEPYYIFFLSTIFSTVIYGFLWVSVVLVYRLMYREATIFGVMNSILIGFDLINILRRRGLSILSFIGFYHLMTIAVIISLSIYLLIVLFNKSEKEKILIKKSLLNFGTQFLQLEVMDIAEKCAINRTKVKLVIQEMIKQKEIYASYSNKSK